MFLFKILHGPALFRWCDGAIYSFLHVSSFRNDLVNHRGEREEKEVEVVVQRRWEAAGVWRLLSLGWRLGE